MTTQHTPGPWITGDASIWALDDCEFHAIVDCPLNQTCRDTETAWANARLIAASPDLLAALENMVSHFPHWAAQIDMKQIDRDAIGMARAAIAKATGEIA